MMCQETESSIVFSKTHLHWGIHSSQHDHLHGQFPCVPVYDKMLKCSIRTTDVVCGGKRAFCDVITGLTC